MMITTISLVNWLGAFICFLSCFSCKHIAQKDLCVGSPKTIQNVYYHSNKSNTEDATCLARLIKENKYTRKMPTCLHQFTLVNTRSMVCAMDTNPFMHGGDTRAAHTYCLRILDKVDCAGRGEAEDAQARSTHATAQARRGVSPMRRSPWPLSSER